MNTVISQKISTTRATMATAALVLAAMLACPSSASAQICAYICPAGQIWTGGTTCLSQCNGVSSSVNNGDGICEVNAENSGNTPADCPTGVDPNILPFCPGYLITDLSIHKFMIPAPLYGWRSQETAQRRSNDDGACTAANGGTPAIYIMDFENLSSGPGPFFLPTFWRSGVCCPASTCGVSCNSNGTCDNGETYGTCPADCGNCTATSYSAGGACDASMPIGAAGNGASTPYNCSSMGACSGTFNAVCTNGFFSYSGSCCGNGVIEAGEQCDDGMGITNGDGCSSTCQCDGPTPVYSSGHCCPAGQTWDGSACVPPAPCTYYFDYNAPLPLDSSGCTCIDAGIPGGPTVCPVNSYVPPYSTALWVSDFPLPGNAVLIMNECTTYFSAMWGANAKFLYTLWSANCGATICGNGICDISETFGSCPADCFCNMNSTCEPGHGETNANCTDDCPCNNDGNCNDAKETEINCPADCGCNNNGTCDLGRDESCANCYADCNVPTPMAISGTCGPGLACASSTCGANQRCRLQHNSCGADSSVCITVADCPVCGNDIIEAGELCDNDNVNGETCATQGFTSGTLYCDGTCTGYDTSNCIGSCASHYSYAYGPCGGTCPGGLVCASNMRCIQHWYEGACYGSSYWDCYPGGNACNNCGVGGCDAAETTGGVCPQDCGGNAVCETWQTNFSGSCCTTGTTWNAVTHLCQ